MFCSVCRGGIVVPKGGYRKILLRAHIFVVRPAMPSQCCSWGLAVARKQCLENIWLVNHVCFLFLRGTGYHVES